MTSSGPVQSKPARSQAHLVHIFFFFFLKKVVINVPTQSDVMHCFYLKC